jgi:hypothetical protein
VEAGVAVRGAPRQVTAAQAAGDLADVAGVLVENVALVLEQAHEQDPDVALARGEQEALDVAGDVGGLHLGAGDRVDANGPVLRRARQQRIALLLAELDGSVEQPEVPQRRLGRSARRFRGVVGDVALEAEHLVAQEDHGRGALASEPFERPPEAARRHAVPVADAADDAEAGAADLGRHLRVQPDPDRPDDASGCAKKSSVPPGRFRPGHRDPRLPRDRFGDPGDAARLRPERLARDPSAHHLGTAGVDQRADRVFLNGDRRGARLAEAAQDRR